MQDIFDTAKLNLIMANWDHQLVVRIPLIEGGVERGEGIGHTIGNDFYHENIGLCMAFWDQVKAICQEKDKTYRFVGICVGVRRGRPHYFMGFQATT